MERRISLLSQAQFEALRLVCPGCNGRIDPSSFKDYGVVVPEGYKYIYYCCSCKRHCCCPVSKSYFGSYKCPECGGKLNTTGRVAKVSW